MGIEEIEQKIQIGIRAQSAWKSPMFFLWDSQRSKGQPEFARNLETSFYSYDSDAEQDRLAHTRLSPTTEQMKIAVQVMDWLTYAAKKYDGRNKAVIRAIIALRCKNLDRPYYGFRSIAKDLKKVGISLSHMTIQRRYDAAMKDLEKWICV